MYMRLSTNGDTFFVLVAERNRRQDSGGVVNVSGRLSILTAR